MLRKVLKTLGIGFGIILLLLAGAYFYFVYTPEPDRPDLSADIEQSFVQIGGSKRSFSFYVPADLPAGSPLIFVFHGSLQDAEDIRTFTGYEFERLADENKFAVIYPNGFENNWNDCRKSASYPAKTQNIDDKGFVKALTEKFEQEYKINPKRVFAVGYSNGAHFAYRLALEMPDKISGIAAVGASLPTRDNNDCQELKQPIPAMIINGTDDPFNPYNGGKVTIFGFGSRGRVLSSNETAEYFAENNNQTSDPTITLLPNLEKNDTTAVRKHAYQKPNQPEVILYEVKNGGHVIPQSIYNAPRMLGQTTQDLNAPAEIWNFFASQK